MILDKTSEFLDSMCTAGPLNNIWYSIKTKDFGCYVWRQHDSRVVFKIYNFDNWLQSQNIVREAYETVSCAVRDVIDSKAKICTLQTQEIELWVNVIMPFTLNGKIRVEAYIDQHAALSDAELELIEGQDSLEVHTKAVKINIIL